MRYFGFIVFVIYSFSSVGQCIKNPTDFSDCNFTAVAHRGYSEFYPENTLVAIEEAFKRGIKFCEIDVAISSDNIYVLHHDPYSIARTTNGSGTISNNLFNDLNLLDVGFWKASYFSETKMPTLIEALNLAEKYDGYLYLDIKGFNPELMANSLAQSDADPTRMLPAITSLESAIDFRNYCPNSNWVWFGANPENLEDDNWYNERINLGCKFFELAEDEVFQDIEWFYVYRDKVHENGGKLWVYTINNEERINTLAEMGVDGVETDRPYVAQLKCCGFDPPSLYPRKVTTGNWNFEKLSLESTGVGSMLDKFSSDGATVQEIVFGNTTEMGLPLIEGKESKIAKIPAYNPSNGLFAFDNFMMEDSGSVDYTYSVILDIFIPSVHKGNYIALIQTNPDNLNDADFFINPEGALGTNDDYHGNFNFDSWQRVLFVLNGNKVQKYLNGEFLGETIVDGGRWTAFNNMAYHGKHGILLFADDNTETAELYVSAIQLRNYAIGSDEAQKLGSPKADGIPLTNANLYTTGIENLEMELIDWEQQTIFIKPAEGSLNDVYNYNLQLSYGATADIPLKGTFNFSNGEKSLTVKAEDGSTKNWVICRQIPTNSPVDLAQNQIRYYPNPFTEIVNMELKEPGFFTLYNLNGQCLVQEEFTKGFHQINLNELQSGTYFLKVISGSGEISSGKIIKQ